MIVHVSLATLPESGPVLSRDTTGLMLKIMIIISFCLSKLYTGILFILGNFFNVNESIPLFVLVYAMVSTLSYRTLLIGGKSAS